MADHPTVALTARPVRSPLRDQFAEAVDRLGLGAGTVLIAVSGGGDSVALLDLAVYEAPRRGWQLRVVHFDHGIAAESGLVAQRVRALAGRYDLPFDTERGQLGRGTSETRARSARLCWFKELIERYQPVALLTAHHADDQVETLLMRFLRGSGPAGLVGIRPWNGRIARPLLAMQRADLAGHLRQVGLDAWTDPANTDSRHLRSWLRTSIIPPIEKRLPALRENLLAAADVAAEERLAWDVLLEQLPGLAFEGSEAGVSVAAPVLAGYPSALIRAILRSMGRRVGVPIGARGLDRIQMLLRQGDTGQRVDVGRGVFAELSFGRVGLHRGIREPLPVHLSGGAGRATFGAWTLEWKPDRAPSRLERGGATTWIAAGGPVWVRPWRAGDTIRPIRGRGTRLVVRCMQDQRIGRSARAGWPVVEVGQQVVWVPGVCRGEALVPASGTVATRIDARPS